MKLPYGRVIPSNFQFLAQEYPFLAEEARKAEAYALVDPRAACFFARRVVELSLRWMFEHDAKLRQPASSKVAALLAEPALHQLVPGEIRRKWEFIRLLGNKAVHGRGKIRQWDGLQVVKELFHCQFWFQRTYTRFSPTALAELEFDEGLLRRISPEAQIDATTLEKLEEELARRDEELEMARKARDGYEEEIRRLRQEMAAVRERNEQIALVHDFNEEETRDRFIDLLLEEAGWDPAFEDGQLRTREFPVPGMPNRAGEGRADYVLWGADGMPLAVIEAKRAKRDARMGQNQAKLYADCLESAFGQRPVVFWTNGFSHWVWDDERYPPRRVQGFFKRDELEWLIQQRSVAQSLGSAKIDRKIADRYYQEQAIRHVTEELEAGRRRCLVVMATGSGKTRTVIALADILQRCNWVKRILFLADRTALVKQATNAFKKYLPHSNAVNLVLEKEHANSRVLLSTYPTMMGLIDARDENGRRFGPAHFDLIVIDEAHRSVYQKYRAIFDYFDALLVGLTATPRDEVDRDTYRLFELQRGVPTYAYELEQAVEDRYLVPPRLVSVPLKFPREGIRYDELAEEDKEQWDLTEWSEDGDVPESVEAAALNQWLFNTDTIDKVLQHLFEKGLKVNGGDRLGKTIIFARNHKHAVFIQERVDANFPHLKGRFARVIDNQTEYSQDLIDKFGDPKNPSDAPQIAISVDMLDTGIDVPEVVNLVFFKTVRSRTKFWQMIGRGTRLRPDLFGPGQDKAYFYVFDYCGNFEFFSENPEGIEGSLQEALGARIFKRRLELLEILNERDPELAFQEGDAAEQREAQAYRALDYKSGILDVLHAEVASMNVGNFMVRAKREIVEPFQSRDRWERLEKSDYGKLAAELAGLPNQLDPDAPETRFFDLLTLNLQLALLLGDPVQARHIDRLREIAARLEELERIPAVKQEIVLIQQIQTDLYWEDASPFMVEHIRRRLRGLVGLIEKQQQRLVTTDFEDVLGADAEVTLPNLSAALDRAEYRRKVEEFLKHESNHITLHKLRHNEQLTRRDIDELERILFESGDYGSREAFEACFGGGISLGRFIRNLVGLDREAAKKAFSAYLDSTRFNTRQIQFINLIIDHLTEQGVMDPGRLFEPPFTLLSAQGPSGLFDDGTSAEIISILREIADNAG